jgi:hypothetical protein
MNPEDQYLSPARSLDCFVLCFNHITQAKTKSKNVRQQSNKKCSASIMHFQITWGKEKNSNFQIRKERNCQSQMQFTPALFPKKRNGKSSAF